MGIGIGDKGDPVQVAHPPVHGGIRRKPGLGGKDVTGKVAKTLLNGVKTGLGTQHGEPRGPDMGWYQIPPIPGLQHNLQKIPGVQPQDGTPVRRDIADGVQSLIKVLHHLHIREIDQVVILPDPALLFIDTGDLNLENEPHFSPPA